MSKPKPHTFKVTLPGELADMVKLRAFKGDRDYQAEIARALRSYYKLKAKG